MVTRMQAMFVGALLLGTLRPWPAMAEATSLAADVPLTYLTLKGPVSLFGNAPLPLTELPLGEYRLTAKAPGHPAARCRLLRTATDLTTSSWAGKWALLKPPGLVHLNRDEERGWFWMGAAATSAAMAGVWQAWTKDAEDDLEQAESAYARAVSEAAIAATRRDVQAALRKRDDYREVRRLWLGYCAAAWFGAGLEAVLLTPRPALQRVASGEYRLTNPRPGRLRAGLRSALVPGAGQRSLGCERRGNFFLSATALLAAGTLAAHDALLEAQRDQADAQNRFDAAEAESELAAARLELEERAGRVNDRETLRWVFLGATAGVYAWNVIDAMSGDHSNGNSQLAWSLTPRTDGVLICASWSLR